MTQAFNELEISSQEAIPSDESTVVPDIRRQGVSFYGTKIMPLDNDPLDSHILRIMNNFAGDDLTVNGHDYFSIESFKVKFNTPDLSCDKEFEINQTIGNPLAF